MFSPAGNAPMPYNRYASSHRRRTGHGGDGEDEEERPSIFRLESIGTLGSTEVGRRRDRALQTTAMLTCQFCHRWTTLTTRTCSRRSSAFNLQVTRKSSFRRARRSKLTFPALHSSQLQVWPHAAYHQSSSRVYQSRTLYSHLLYPPKLPLTRLALFHSRFAPPRTVYFPSNS